MGKLIKPVQANQTLGSSLPHKNVQVEPSILSKDTQITGINKMSSTEKKASVFSNIPAEEDLKETSEAQFTEEIKELAESLNSVIEIYEYVRNNINFEAYYGSRKGAVGTLDQMAGNDIDQASLLISLLRYKGIPARYVRGTIEIPVEKVMGWTGGETPQDAVRILASLGIPTVSVVSGGKISHVRTEHVWVEAYVPYQYYRGAGPMKGQKIWVPLDPSFKQHEKIEGLDLSSIIDIDTEASIEGFKDGIIVSDSSRNAIKNTCNKQCLKCKDKDNLTECEYRENACGYTKWMTIKQLPRLILEVPRGTKKYKKIKALRSSSERTNSYGKEWTGMSNLRLWGLRAYAVRIALCCIVIMLKKI